LSGDEAHILNQIAPEIAQNQSTLNPIIAALTIALLAWGISSSYFTRFFHNVSYLPIVQSGMIFSAVLLTFLFLT